MKIDTYAQVVRDISGERILLISRPVPTDPVAAAVTEFIGGTR
jgi:hypothetical protein